MADTWRENAIVEAILIIADKKIAQAGYDRTIKGVINKVIDKTKGKYQIKYQDSLFEAFSTSAKIEYVKNQLVSVLIPGNDWDRVKTILGGVDIKATNYQQIPIASLNYNRIGTSGTSLKKNIELSSYVGNTGAIKDLVTEGYITLNNTTNFINYVKRGNGIALGMKVRTALADGQIGGDYGLRFYLKFSDNVTGNEVIKEFTVSTKDVIGQPYLLTSDTIVLTLIKDVDILNFKGISSIEAYCTGFPGNIDKIDINDIFISDVFINGASVLSDLDLNGYVLHIDYSEKGNIIGGNLTTVPVVALLKVNGKITTLDVEYYWFRLNGTVFKGDLSKYSGFAGDGWECLNYWTGSSFVPKTNGKFNFKNGEPNTTAEKTDIQKNNTAYAPQKVTKILCVAIYDNKEWVRGLALIINNNKIDFIIETKQSYDGIKDNPVKNIYYLDNGTPTLICKDSSKKDDEWLGIVSNYNFTWSVKPARGSAVKVEESSLLDFKNLKLIESDDFKKYNSYKQLHDIVVKRWLSTEQEKDEDNNNIGVFGRKIKAEKMAQINANDYILTKEYTNAKSNFEKVLSAPWVYQNQYINFPIKSISDYSIVSCAVTQNGVYKGTASITLYNKMLLEGMYSLNLEHGTQVFQYDGKGNSPASPQIEKPILIKPLTFTLIDNEGKLISHEQIKKNGWIKWIFPNTQSLLTQSNNGTATAGNNDLTVSRADLPLAANSYSVFKNRDSFNYGIANRYDEKKNINYIWLNIKFKDLSFDAYTNFTFPKDGDPGTNGTNYISKIVPSKNTDRVYISSKATSTMFSDDGDTIDKLEYIMYNNSVATSYGAHYWTAPPKVTTSAGEDKGKIRTTFLTVTPQDLSNNTYKTTKVSLSVPSDLNFDNIITKAPVNIVRAQYGTDNRQGYTHYFAEIPICTEYINGNYRLKIKPKTGYSYVVYSSDGTSANYDNSLPFEIVVEKLVTNYYTTDTNLTYTYKWNVIGNLNGSSTNTKKTYTASPKTTFDGRNLTSAVVCQVKKGDSLIGFIHVPIYMILNRYNNRALNAWDGNSVQIDKNGYGLILTPQIAAGAKDSDNAFTGMLMGQIALNTANADIGKNGDIGIMGYDSGVRTLFLDAKTGKAEFGKNNQGKIIIDPDAKWPDGSPNGTDAAFLYSNGFNVSKYLNNNGAASTVHNYYAISSANPGMMIDLTSPAIHFGSGRFYVNKNGNIHAAGAGDIAGWQINDDAFYKHDGTYKTGMRSNGDPAFYAGTNAQNSISPTSTTAYNFFVNHNGYLYSKSGRIATWDIDDKTLSNSDVGMGLNKSDITFIYDESSKTATISKGNGRFWAGNKFIVDKNGKMYSNSAQIGPWTVSQSLLTNGIVGMGTKTFTKEQVDGSFGVNTLPSTATGTSGRLWSLYKPGTNEENINFLVNGNGYLFSKAGRIGGWKITQKALSSDGITIGSSGTGNSATGYIKTTNYTPNSTVGWQINSAGDAYFNNLYARGTGEIGPWTISETELTNGKVGLGTHNFSKSDASTAFNREFTKPILARIWGRDDANSDVRVNFIVDNNGHLYSKAGTIAGWTIEQNKLSADGITIESTPNGGQIIASGKGDNSEHYWKIDSDGDAVFNNLTANKTGYIAGWKITPDKFEGSTLNQDGTAAMTINAEGSLKGPGWSIDKSGNATFNHIDGVIAKTDGSAASLTGGSGGYSGNGYTLNSDGSFRMGSSGGAMNFSDGALTIGPWTISNEGIYTEEDVHIYPTGYKIGHSQMFTEGIAADKYYIQSGGTQIKGKTGTLSFPDGSSITVNGGLIVGVSGGEDAIYTGD